MANQRRNHFRVEYPASERPRLRVNGRDFYVIDISEAGLRFTPQGDPGIKSGDEFKGSLSFSDGVTYIVVGTVLRVEADQVILVLNQGVPFARMLSEERAVLQKLGKKTG